MENYDEHSKIAYRQSIEGAEFYANLWFNAFLKDYHLFNLHEDIFKKYFDYYKEKCKKTSRENSFFDAYFRERKEFNDTGTSNGYLIGVIFAYKFDEKLSWHEVTEEASVSIAFARVIEMLNDWKVNNDKVPDTTVKINETNIKVINPEKEPTLKQYAMYYHYLIDTEINQRFENTAGGKMIAIKEIAARHRISSKKFQLSYNKICNDTSERCSGTPKNLKDFEAVISMLNCHPKAKEKALEELNKAKLNGDKRGNPVT